MHIIRSLLSFHLFHIFAHEISLILFPLMFNFQSEYDYLNPGFHQHTKDSTAGVSVKYNLSAYVASCVPNNLYTMTAAVAFYHNYNG